MKSQWRNLEKERQEAMHRAEKKDSLRQSYANRFSSKNEPTTERPMSIKKLKRIRSTYRKCVILSNQIKERQKK